VVPPAFTIPTQDWNSLRIALTGEPDPLTMGGVNLFRRPSLQGQLAQFGPAEWIWPLHPAASQLPAALWKGLGLLISAQSFRQLIDAIIPDVVFVSSPRIKRVDKQQGF